MPILRPEFFDIFGLAVFSFLLASAAWSLRTHQPLPRWALWLIVAIGIAGLLVDRALVVRRI
ncbi:hypothetical protein C4552_01570 [Candidatus Parcubacteria bacterium]|nr:MAG: hypothetical protein C4552_01570 [Candidatus Parcubacteria bacterium]